MGNENATLRHRQPKDSGVGDAVESGRESALEIYGWFVAQYARADGVAKIVIGLKPRPHLFRVPGMKLFARGKEALAQVLRKWRRISALDIEALELAHPISVDGRLAFEVESDRAEYLGKSQSLEFRKDGFG